MKAKTTKKTTAKTAKRASKKVLVIELTRQQIAAVKAWKTIRANRAA